MILLDLFEYIKTLVEEYRLKLGVKTKPRIEVNNRWKRKIAHSSPFMTERYGSSIMAIHPYAIEFETNTKAEKLTAYHT